MHQRKFEEALRQFHPRPTAVCCENLLAMLKAMQCGRALPCLMSALEYQSTPISKAEHCASEARGTTAANATQTLRVHRQ
jgi:hypothetical protein